MAGRTFKVKVTGVEFSGGIGESLMEYALQLAETAADKVGPHVAEVAQARAPVSKDRNYRKFRPVAVRGPGSLGAEPSFGGGLGTELGGRLKEIRSLSTRERSTFIKGGFGLRTKSPSVTKFFEGTGRFKGQQPEEIRVGRGGSITGGFRHVPGTLKKSIHYAGSERSGNTVVATVVADAPYALYVHEGYPYRGGSDHQGESKNIPGNPFLADALVNVIDRLTSPSTYETG